MSNVRFLNDPALVRRLFTVHEQLVPRGSTETYRERKERYRREELQQRIDEERRAAQRQAKLLRGHKRVLLTLAAKSTLEWLDKKKPRP